MQVNEGTSFLESATDAVAQATADWPRDLDLLVAYCSTKQDAGEVARALGAKYPGVPMVGCSSTGEHLSGAHSNGSLVVVGLAQSETQWSVATLDDLSTLDQASAEDCAAKMFLALNVDRDEFDPSEFFCLCLIDGLSAMEEKVASLMADALDGVALVGGSAGDDLKFEKTQVICNGRAFSGGAVFVLAHPKTPFRVIKHQHFTTTAKSVVITKADADARTVYEMDGYPAAECYARSIGVPLAELDGAVSFLNPITLQIDGELYVRSVQKVNEDGSLVFYCAVEEGMVLEIGRHQDIGASLKEHFSELAPVDFMFGFNCILRALETSEEEKHDELGRTLNRFAPHYIAFDTYGEQLNGLHINQTFVAVAFEKAA